MCAGNRRLPRQVAADSWLGGGGVLCVYGCIVLYCTYSHGHPPPTPLRLSFSVVLLRLLHVYSPPLWPCKVQQANMRGATTAGRRGRPRRPTRRHLHVAFRDPLREAPRHPPCLGCVTDPRCAWPRGSTLLYRVTSMRLLPPTGRLMPPTRAAPSSSRVGGGQGNLLDRRRTRRHLYRHRVLLLPLPKAAAEGPGAPPPTRDGRASGQFDGRVGRPDVSAGRTHYMPTAMIGRRSRRWSPPPTWCGIRLHYPPWSQMAGRYSPSRTPRNVTGAVDHTSRSRRDRTERTVHALAVCSPAATAAATPPAATAMASPAGRCGRPPPSPPSRIRLTLDTHACPAAAHGAAGTDRKRPLPPDQPFPPVDVAKVGVRQRHEPLRRSPVTPPSEAGQQLTRQTIGVLGSHGGGARNHLLLGHMGDGPTEGGHNGRGVAGTEP